MSSQVLFAGSRSATVRLDVPGLYETEQPISMTLNGIPVPAAGTVVTTLWDLEPDTAYTLQAGSETLTFRTEAETATLDIRVFGAVGDGVHDDTASIQAAILCCPVHGRVLIPAGRWHILPLFLKSGIRIHLEKDAVLVLDTDRRNYPILPGDIGGVPLAGWEGLPDNAFASLITGVDVEDTVIFGQGTIDGNAQNSDWWVDAKKKRIAWRGNMLFLRGCRGFTMQGINVQNSPSWNLHPFRSDDLKFLNVSVTAPWDSPNTDGLDPESCSGVLIAGCHFSLGDDCIAVKSSKLDMPQHIPCRGIEIAHCLMENGHGGVTIGSEMAGGVQEMTVHHTMMRNTDRGLRIKTRRGRGKDGVIDGITFDTVRMEQVGTPFVVNSLYFCDPDGHSEYVQTLKKLPVDERTPRIGRMTFRNIEADGCACAGYFLGLPEKPVEELILENVSVVCDPDTAPMQPAMSDCVGEMNRTGFVIRNTARFIMKNVTVTGCEGHWLQADSETEIIEG